MPKKIIKREKKKGLMLNIVLVNDGKDYENLMCKGLMLKIWHAFENSLAGKALHYAKWTTTGYSLLLLMHFLNFI